MGLDIYLSDGDEDMSAPSDKYPDHICNKGYLRSSYNPSGFNNFVGNLIGKDLYWIFAPVSKDPGNEEGDLRPGKAELLSCRLNAMRVLSELRAAESLEVVTVSADLKATERGEARIDGAKIALNTYRDEVKTHKEAKEKREAEGKTSPFDLHDNYQSSKGHFFLDDPITVKAAIPGINILGHPCVHLVITTDKTFYVQMAEIIIEFIDQAMLCDDPRIGWSA